MTPSEIQIKLEELPAMIARMGEREIMAFKKLLIVKEEYETLRAKTYLTLKAQDMKIKDIEYHMDIDLLVDKHKVIEAEIAYKSLRNQKEQLYNDLQCTLEYGRILRMEWKSIEPVIKQEEEKHS
jgi:hypothetical protein